MSLIKEIFENPCPRQDMTYNPFPYNKRHTNKPGFLKAEVSLENIFKLWQLCNRKVDVFNGY